MTRVNDSRFLLSLVQSFLQCEASQRPSTVPRDIGPHGLSQVMFNNCMRVLSASSLLHKHIHLPVSFLPWSLTFSITQNSGTGGSANFVSHVQQYCA